MSGCPAARRATFARVRSAISGAFIASVLPACGVIRQFGSDHSGCPSGSGVGADVGEASAGACVDALDLSRRIVGRAAGFRP